MQSRTICQHHEVGRERLGQSQISVTLATYSHVLPSMQREAAEKAERLVLGGPNL